MIFGDCISKIIICTDITREVDKIIMAFLGRKEEELV